MQYRLHVMAGPASNRAAGNRLLPEALTKFWSIHHPTTGLGALCRGLFLLRSWLNAAETARSGCCNEMALAALSGRSSHDVQHDAPCLSG
jgi:hypothetical protein